MKSPLAVQLSPLLRRLAPAAVLCSTLFGCAMARGQATETATQDLRIRFFGMYSRVNPEFANSADNNGATFGVDVDTKIPHVRGIKPGLEIREVFSNGPVANERVFSGGPQIVLSGGRFHPYGNFLIGSGVITFTHPAPNYPRDTSTVYSYGGGLDVSLNQGWAVRVDYHRQSWQLQQTAPKFYPTQLSFGLRYQLHLRNRYGPE